MSQGHSPATPLLFWLKVSYLHVALCVGTHGLCLVGWRPLRRPVGTHGLCVHCVKSYSVRYVAL